MRTEVYHAFVQTIANQTLVLHNIVANWGHYIYVMVTGYGPFGIKFAIGSVQM
jgi:hypothetical protein